MFRYATLATAAFVLFSVSPVNATVLYETTNISSNGWRASDFGTDSNDQRGYRAFDNFTLSGDAAITTVSWTGLYHWWFQPAPTYADTVTWEIAFFTSVGGAPGSALATIQVPAASATQTYLGSNSYNDGSYSYTDLQYAYEVALPTAFDATAGTEYWVSIRSLAPDSNLTFGLMIASGGDGDGQAYQWWYTNGGISPSGNGYGSISPDLAIKLEGTLEGTEAPLPATFLPVASVLAGAALLRRRMRKVA